MFIYNALKRDTRVQLDAAKKALRLLEKRQPVNPSQREEIQRFLIERRAHIAFNCPFNYPKSTKDAEKIKRYNELTRLLNRVNRLQTSKE